jgi:hypothetical protein
MNNIGVFILAVLFVAVFITLVFLWVRLQQNEEEVRLLRREMCNKVSEVVFGFERDNRRQLRNELDAIKEYLDVEVVEPVNKMKMRSKK